MQFKLPSALTLNQSGEGEVTVLRSLTAAGARKITETEDSIAKLKSKLAGILESEIEIRDGYIQHLTDTKYCAERISRATSDIGRSTETLQKRIADFRGAIGSNRGASSPEERAIDIATSERAVAFLEAELVTLRGEFAERVKALHAYAKQHGIAEEFLPTAETD